MFRNTMTIATTIGSLRRRIATEAVDAEW